MLNKNKAHYTEGQVAEEEGGVCFLGTFSAVEVGVGGGGGGGGGGVGDSVLGDNKIKTN